MAKHDSEDLRLVFKGDFWNHFSGDHELTRCIYRTSDKYGPKFLLTPYEYSIFAAADSKIEKLIADLERDQIAYKGVGVFESFGKAYDALNKYVTEEKDW